MAGKNRSFGTDILTNPKTRGLFPLDRDVLLTQVVAANIAGVMRKSVTQIANDAGGGTKPAHVRKSLARLQERGVVRWWPKLDVVWAVEAAKRQARTPNAWKGVANVVEVMPTEVQEAFAERYPRVNAEGNGEGPSQGPPPGSVHTGRKEERKKGRKDNGAPVEAGSGSASKPTPPKTRADVEAERRHAVTRFREAVLYDPECRPTPPGGREMGVPSISLTLLGQRLEEGATAEELHQVAKNLARRISSGELDPKLWGGLGFSWPYTALRDGLPIQGESKPGLAPSTGPKLETAAEARAYAENHGNSLVGTGWVWEQDGRGGSYPVRDRRAGGAA